MNQLGTSATALLTTDLRLALRAQIPFKPSTLGRATMRNWQAAGANEVTSFQPPPGLPRQLDLQLEDMEQSGSSAEAEAQSPSSKELFRNMLSKAGSSFDNMKNKLMPNHL